MSTRIKLLCLACAVAVVLLAGFATPKPTVRTLYGTWGWTADSSVAYRARVFLSGPLGRNDVIRYTLSLNNGASTELARTQTIDTTFTFAAPDYEQTIVYKVCARVFRGESASGGFKCAEQSVTRGPPPEPPAPVVDSVTITPAQVSLGLGKTQQFRAAVFSR